MDESLDLSDRDNLSETKNEDVEISENEDVPVKEVDPILIARNAGASLSAPAKADIARKRKLSVNKGKYEQRESKATGSTNAWDLQMFCFKLFILLVSNKRFVNIR
jgi:hypothetical protein